MSTDDVSLNKRDAFDLLVRGGVLDAELADGLKRMVGLRNIAVHDYARIDLEIVRAIVERHLGDLERFAVESIRAGT